MSNKAMVEELLQTKPMTEYKMSREITKIITKHLGEPFHALEADLIRFTEAHTAKKVREATRRCHSCGKPLSMDCPQCQHLWEN